MTLLYGSVLHNRMLRSQPIRILQADVRYIGRSSSRVFYDLPGKTPRRHGGAARKHVLGDGWHVNH